MANYIFNLANNNEYITLDKLLKLMRLVGSGGEAHAVIQSGMVKVNDTVEFQKRKKIFANNIVEFNGQQIEVHA
jgi:ribosome-associated protein